MKTESPLEILIIDTKKRIFEVQLGEKKYIVNAGKYEAAVKKAAKKYEGGIGILIRVRELYFNEKKHCLMGKNSWSYVDSAYMFKRRLKERLTHRN
jgi:hypothetical protein